MDCFVRINSTVAVNAWALIWSTHSTITKDPNGDGSWCKMLGDDLAATPWHDAWYNESTKGDYDDDCLRLKPNGHEVIPANATTVCWGVYY